MSLLMLERSCRRQSSIHISIIMSAALTTLLSLSEGGCIAHFECSMAIYLWYFVVINARQFVAIICSASSHLICADHPGENQQHTLYSLLSHIWGFWLGVTNTAHTYIQSAIIQHAVRIIIHCVRVCTSLHNVYC